MRNIKFIVILLSSLFVLSCSKAERGEGSEDDGLRLKDVIVNNVFARYDESKLLFDVLLPGVTDFTSIHLSYSAIAEEVLLNGEPFVYGSIVDATRPVTITLVHGGAKKDYTLHVHNTGLPVVSIDTPSSAPIKSKDEWLEGARMTIRDKDGKLEYDSSLSIRGRGNSTWGYPKKPYALKLDEKSKILSMPSNKRWILLANWKDRTLLRNDAAFWLSSHSGLEYTVSGQFVELMLNGKHQGNYYLCEQIKIGKNRVPIQEMDAFETDPEKITGGYLLELDTYYDEPLRFRSPLNLPYQIKQPEEDEISDEAYWYIRNYISELESVLTDEERVLNHDYEEYIDVDSAIEYLIVQELTGNEDFYSTWPENGPHSCYVYKDRDGKLMHGPAWDFDYNTFMPTRSTWWQGATRTMYYPYLLKDDKFKQRLIEIWDERKNEFKGLSEYLDKMTEYLALSAGANHKMWPLGDQKQNGDEDLSFEYAVDRMKEGFEAKWNWMDRNISKISVK